LQKKLPSKRGGENLKNECCGNHGTHSAPSLNMAKKLNKRIQNKKDKGDKKRGEIRAFKKRVLAGTKVGGTRYLLGTEKGGEGKSVGEDQKKKENSCKVAQTKIFAENRKAANPKGFSPRRKSGGKHFLENSNIVEIQPSGAVGLGGEKQYLGDLKKKTRRKGPQEGSKLSRLRKELLIRQKSEGEGSAFMRGVPLKRI